MPPPCCKAPAPGNGWSSLHGDSAQPPADPNLNHRTPTSSSSTTLRIPLAQGDCWARYLLPLPSPTCLVSTAICNGLSTYKATSTVFVHIATQRPVHTPTWRLATSLHQGLEGLDQGGLAGQRGHEGPKETGPEGKFPGQWERGRRWGAGPDPGIGCGYKGLMGEETPGALPGRGQ